MDERAGLLKLREYMDKTCKRCAALSTRLIKSTRAFRAEIAKLLAASR